MKPEKPIRLDFSFAFQFKFSLVMIAGSVLTSVLLYFYFDHQLGTDYLQSLRTLNDLERALPSSLAVTFVIQLVLILLLTVGINLFVSHKIGGPVYRYEQALEDILRGDLSRDVKTRDGDQLKSMVSSLNGWQASMREVFAAAQVLGRELDLALEEGEGGPPDRDRLLAAVEEVRGSMEDYFAVEHGRRE